MRVSEGNWERDVIETLATAALKEQRRARRWGIFFKLLGFAYLTLLVLLALDWRGHDGFTSGKHTALVDVVGVIDPKGDASADRVTEALQNAFKNKNTQGVILRINSPGGSPVQAGIIYDEIRRLRGIYPNVPMYAVVADIFDHGVHGNVGVAAPQPADFVVDDSGLHRAAARRIDAQDHALGILVLERTLERLGDAVGARVAFGVDDAHHIDQRGVLARSEAVVSTPVEHEQHQQREIGEAEQLEKDAPAAGAALLLEGGHRQRLDHVPFPVTFGHADHPS